MAEGYKWQPFSDLPADPRVLGDSELEALHRVWMDQKKSLEQSGALDLFNQRLRREWAIETGVIEGVYTVDRGTTQALIEHGIKASLIPRESNRESPEHVALVLQDHADVLEGLFAYVKEERSLTVGYIKELHAALLRHQETSTVVDQFGNEFERKIERGQYKSLPNNPLRSDGAIHEYCPPEHVASEMDRMIELHNKHVAASMSPELEAAWLHHVFTQIHPFQDGNGRVARAIASLIFIKASWFPIVIARDGPRVKYIEALEAADQGSLRPLVSLFVEIQKKTLIRAIRAASDVKPPQTPSEVIAAALERLLASERVVPPEWGTVKGIAEALQRTARSRLEDVQNELAHNFGRFGSDYTFIADSHAPQDAPDQIAAAAQAIGYDANLSDFHMTASLSFRSFQSGRSSDILISLHTVGRFHGILAALVLFRSDSGPFRAVDDDFFQINYQEDATAAEARFKTWLEVRLTSALNLWRRTLQ